MSVNEKMTAIADVIREKTGGTEKLTLDQMAEAIAGIEAGGGGGAECITGSFTATKANYSLTHNCGFENYLCIIQAAPESVETIQASTLVSNMVNSAYYYGELFKLAFGDYTSDIHNRVVYNYWHGTQGGLHYNAYGGSNTADSLSVNYTVAGATYNYIIIDLGAGT